MILWRFWTNIELFWVIFFFGVNFEMLDVLGNYEVTQDIKQQLRFLEDLDKMEKKRHEEAERELLLRAAKSRYDCL